MSRYIYSAKSQPYKTVRGDIEAESLQEAINKLNKMGYFPVSVQPQEVLFEKQNILHLPKVPVKDMAIFTRQLSSLMGSGVNMLEALLIVGRQAPNKYLRVAIDGVAGRIKDGLPLSECIRAYPGLFSGLYASMVRSGEAAGNLEQVLKRLADFLEKEEEFRASLRQALAYPVFVLAVSVLTVAVLLVFVIPRLAGMFTDMGQALPVPTQILINLSGFLRAYWWLLLFGITAGVFTLRKLYLRPQAKSYFDSIKLKSAFFGKIILKAQISRLMRTLSLLLSSGIPILEALDISTSVLTNEVLRQEALGFRGQISKGASFSRCLKASKSFPAYVTNIVAVGEETGAMEKSLLRLADDYEKEVDGVVKTATRLLEPVVILIMGLIVGFIVLCMLLPIFQINLIAR